MRARRARPAAGFRRWIWRLAMLAAGIAAAGTAREVRLTILHTTDVHGHLWAAPDEEGRAAGGLLRVATAIARVRAETPHVLLVDCGDLIQGSLEADLYGGAPMVRAIEALGYDAWVLGNHEWDWGFEALEKIVASCPVPVLAANLVVRAPESVLARRVAPMVLREVDGVRVAIVGLTTPGMPTWFRPEYLGPAQFLASVEALRRVMPRLREARPDVAILAVHQGWRPLDDRANEIHAIAARFPEFDVVLGGHTHEAVEERALDRALYTQAGCEGRVLGRVDLVYDTVAGRVTAKRAVLIPVGLETPEDTALTAALQRELDRARAVGARVIGQAAATFEAKSGVPGQSAVQQLFCRAIAEASGAEVVLHGVHSDAPLRAGEVRLADVWRIMPYENRVGLARLTRGELAQILEENADLMDSPYFLGVYGLRYRLALDAERGRRVRDVRRADGSIPHPRERLLVAMNSFVLASGGGRFAQLRRIVEQPEARLTLTGVDIREALLEYVRRHSPVEPAPENGGVEIERAPRRAAAGGGAG